MAVNDLELLKPFEGKKNKINSYLDLKIGRSTFTEEENVQSIRRIKSSLKGLSELQSIWQMKAKKHPPNT